MGSGAKIGVSQLNTKGGRAATSLTSQLRTFDANGLPVPPTPDFADASNPDLEGSLYVKKATLTQDGDLFYRAGGAIVRLPVGTPTQVLTVSPGRLPSWAAASGGGGTSIVDYCVMYRNAAFALVGDVFWHLLPLDSVDLDGNTIADTVNNRMIIKTAGRYNISGELQLSANGIRVLSGIYVDSGAGPVFRKQIGDSPGGGVAGSNALLNLNVNDKVYLYYLCLAAGQSLYVGNTPTSINNWLSLSKLP